MTGKANEQLLNSVLINLSRSFLQYLSESSPWVRDEAASAGQAVELLAADQRSDVRSLAELLNAREWHVDFGSFPTEYTDLQFLSLQSMMAGLIHSQEGQIAALADALQTLRNAADAEAVAVLNDVRSHQELILSRLHSLNNQVQSAAV